MTNDTRRDGIASYPVVLKAGFTAYLAPVWLLALGLIPGWFVWGRGESLGMAITAAMALGAIAWLVAVAVDRRTIMADAVEVRTRPSTAA